MNLKTSPFSILNKERRELDYIKGVYKRRVQAEIDSYKDSEDESKRDTIQTQDVLMIDRVSIWLFIYLLMPINSLITKKNFRKGKVLWAEISRHMKWINQKFRI